jgi:HPt (histidine-containing phosphotransfer) domain-containing protein
MIDFASTAAEAQTSRTTSEPTIDFVHLARMTLGDRALEQEVLTLFVCQAGMLMARMHGASPALVCATAHTLKGSAQGIGAFAVAQAAERLESAARLGEDLGPSFQMLVAAVADARSVISALARTH